MREIVRSDPEKCVGCNRCIRECPIETANSAYLDDNGEIKVKLDSTACIACGKCLSVCRHEARFYEDDTERFFEDLEKGVPISVIAAPSLKTNFPEWGRILSWFRQKKANRIYDASFGADICVWANLRFIETHPDEPFITQSCPAVVSYCEKHNHDLLKHLSPVHSPMLCTAVFMREYEGVTDRIAAVTPCTAKTNEFSETGIVDYNITFAMLEKYILSRGELLPEEESGFDGHRSGLGTVFPVSGGFKENIEFFAGKDLRIDVSEGKDVFKKLKEYAVTEASALPDIFDVLSCSEGCSSGSACVPGSNVFRLQAAVNAGRSEAVKDKGKEYYLYVHDRFDALLDLNCFLREYKPAETKTMNVTEEEIQKSFGLLGKMTFAAQNFNCGACGSETCYDMARKIALNLNIPSSCIYKSHEDAKAEHQKKSSYIKLVHKLGENMISIAGYDYINAVTNSLKELCTAFGSSLVSMWTILNSDGNVRCERLFHWPEEENRSHYSARHEWPEQWLNKLAAGEHIFISEKADEPSVFPEQNGSFLAVPLTVDGVLWGFLTFSNNANISYTSEEISSISACGLLIASAIREKQLELTASVDTLTNVYNRGYFMRTAFEEFRNALQTKRKCFVIMMDIDQFKLINDTYGHPAGDEILRSVAARIERTLRSGDLFARVGGEEFAVLLSDSDERKAAFIAERIRREISSSPCTYGEYDITVTISIGLASNESAKSLDELLKNADKALYTAKNNGRDQVVCYEPDRSEA